MAHLSSLTKPQGVHPLSFTGTEFVVGRHPDCRLVIDSPSISRYHACFLHDGSEFFVKDLGSRNHTYLNGVELDPKASPSKLKDEDRVSFCDLEYVFRVADPPPANQGILFVDDDAEASHSTIMSKVGVSSNHGSVQLTASPEAKLNALLAINRSLGRSLALDEVLPQVLNSLFKIFVQADRGFIALRGPDGTLVPRWSKAWREDADETIRVSRTIVNKVMETQEGILSADVMMDEEFNTAQSIADFRIRSMMCAPLIDSLGNSIGVIQIDTVRQAKRFQQEDLEVLLAVAGPASSAIDNAELHEQALRQRVVDRDLELAREVQNGFLPDSRPVVEGYEFYDLYRPANQVGGDYFDYLRLPDDRIAIIVADVSGKGVAAALLMAKLSAEARYALASAADAGAAISILNDRLCRLHVDRFVTAVLAILDPVKHTIGIASAGHMAPMLRNAQGEVTEPGDEAAGLPLGITAGMDYPTTNVDLAVGDTVTMYTDGLNEAANAADDLYTIDRIRQTVKATAGSPEKVGQTLVDDVCEFVGDAPQSDDMCLVTFGRI